MSKTLKDIQENIEILNQLLEKNKKIIDLQERIIEARKYLLKDIDEKEINYWQRSELFKILGDKENE